MRVWNWLLLMVGLLTCGGAWGERTLAIGTEASYPPFAYVDAEDRLQGFDIDISRALCEQLERRCELQNLNFDALIPGLLSRRFDAVVASLSITPEREQVVDFTDKYYHTPAKFVRRKGSGIEIEPESMRGLVVGVQRASTHDRFLTERFSNVVKIRRYVTQEEAYMDLVAGRLQLVLGDSVALQTGLLEQDMGRDFEFVGPDYNDPRWFGRGAGIAVRKGNEELRQALNQALQAIRDSGEYQRIQDRYFDFDIYGP
jgi:arginine/ornithine transport system substrate-binding protein